MLEWISCATNLHVSLSVFSNILLLCATLFWCFCKIDEIMYYQWAMVLNQFY